MSEYNKEIAAARSEAKNKAIASSSETAKQSQNGIGTNPVRDPFPARNNNESEYVLRGTSNAHIVFGKDRVDEHETGYGGRGHARTGMMHLVAGHFGANLHLYKERENEVLVSNPNFSIDSAYIYISQKADIDEYLKLKEGTVGNPAKKSAIAIKSDSVRIVGDRGIKLVTRVNSEDSFREKIFEPKGIDLIAGNDDSDLQPMIKGQNMIKSVEELSNLLALTIEAMMEIHHYQADALLASSAHQHMTTIPGAPTLPYDEQHISDNMAAATMYREVTTNKLDNIRKDIESYKTKYLTNNGETYIASRFNNTN